MTPSKELGRLVALYTDEHGVSDSVAREAVCATLRGKELQAQRRAELESKVRPPQERIEEIAAQKWAEYEPGASRPPLVIRWMVHAPLLIAHVDGLPPKLMGCAVGRFQFYEPPLIVLRAGMDVPTRRRVFAHELAHLIFDSQMIRDAHDEREARAHEVGALILETFG